MTRTGPARSRQGSCGGCLAWGAVPPLGLCRPCAEFSSRNREATGRCGSCGRHQPLKKGYCRLCWCQARLDRDQARQGPPVRYDSLLPFVGQVRCHQLFFAGMPGPRDLVRPGGALRPGTGHGSPGIPRKQAPPAAPRPAGTWEQLMLFTGARREFARRRIDRRSGPVPDNPWLAWALHLAHATAAARGWSPVLLDSVTRQLVMLLASYADGEMIRVSDFKRAITRQGEGITWTVEILGQMGILADDRPAAFTTWLAGQLDGLAPGIAAEAGRWAHAARGGTPRSPALHENSVRTYVASVRPALADWSARYDHLREVTRDDVRGYLATLHGDPRRTTLSAFRSLFGWAKTSGVIFANPASHLRGGNASGRSSCPWPTRRSPAPSTRPPHRTTGCSSRWPPSTPPGPARSAPCSSATSTWATAGSASAAWTAPSMTSPARC